MPDFDSLGPGSNAGASQAGGSTSFAGVSGYSISGGGSASSAGSKNSNSGGTGNDASFAGTSDLGGAAGADNGGSTPGGATNGGTTGGTAVGGSATGGTATGGTAVGGAATGGTVTGGAGGGSSCAPPVGATRYNGFDKNLNGVGFVQANAYADMATTHAATGSSAWDPGAGKTCPGALQYSFVFPDYASGSAADEVGTGTYAFATMDWSKETALRVMVKVSPPSAPLTGVRLFVMSGQYLYYSIFDDSTFKTGDWHEMYLQPVAGGSYEPTNVFRIGVSVALLRAGSPGIPTKPPAIDVWLDDLWLQPK